MLRLLLASCLAGVASANLASVADPTECLDMKAPCEDGSDDADCKRVKTEGIKKGANLQSWHCHNKPNQAFEVVGGRLHNKLVPLCVDVKAECVDSKDDDPHCKRQAVKDIKAKANIQLWTCRKSDAEGMKSDSYGNQLWDLMQDGTIRNGANGLCLTKQEEKKDETNGANIYVDVCEDPPTPTQKWILKTEAAEATRLFEVLPGHPASLSAPAAVVGSVGAAACVMAFAAAAVFFRSRRSLPSELPLTSAE